MNITIESPCTNDNAILNYSFGIDYSWLKKSDVDNSTNIHKFLVDVNLTTFGTSLTLNSSLTPSLTY